MGSLYPILVREPQAPQDSPDLQQKTGRYSIPEYRPAKLPHKSAATTYCAAKSLAKALAAATLPPAVTFFSHSIALALFPRF